MNEWKKLIKDESGVWIPETGDVLAWYKCYLFRAKRRRFDTQNNQEYDYVVFRWIAGLHLGSWAYCREGDIEYCEIE